MMELRMSVLGISDGYLHTSKMQQSITWVWRGQWDPKDQKGLEHQVVCDLGELIHLTCELGESSEVEQRRVQT